MRSTSHWSTSHCSTDGSRFAAAWACGRAKDSESCQCTMRSGKCSVGSAGTWAMLTTFKLTENMFRFGSIAAGMLAVGVLTLATPMVGAQQNVTQAAATQVDPRIERLKAEALAKVDA